LREFLKKSGTTDRCSASDSTTKLDEPTRPRMPDRCACGCGRFVEEPGDYATDWCIENTIGDHMVKNRNPEEPDVVY